MNVKARLLSSLVKVFPSVEPPKQPECCRLTALRGEKVSFQIAYKSDENIWATVGLSSPFGDRVSVRSVEYVPVRLCGYPEAIEADGGYLSAKPGSFPDPLRELRGGRLRLTRGRYRTLWIEVDVELGTPAGDYDITVTLEGADGAVLCSTVQRLTVYGADLPEASLIHTEWFHTDCIADHYGYEVFGEEHWRAIESFMRVAAERGINMILTPIFTPPLDTQVGGERTTVQLVDVSCDGGRYSFGFERLHRWVEVAHRAGIKYFEISHLFTQWGATSAPKIMATVDGGYRRAFGWDTTVEAGEYPEFLRVFLPRLVEELKSLGIDKKCYFHVSDEPSVEHLDNYMRAKNIIAPYLKGFKIIDALSNVDFYDNGTVAIPVPASDHITPFLERDIKERWTYYCCGQGIGCSNRFMAMSLARTRALGIQLFKFGISGFLQWGYDFYNSQFSIMHIDPYKITDGGSPDGETVKPAFPAGDAFVVYPGRGGVPEESIRLLAFYSAQTDLRALNALAEKTSREHVLSLLEDELATPISFTEYPQSDHYYISLRNRVNRELAE